MNFTVFGAGHIGIATALSLVDKNHRVFCVDIDQNKVDLLKSGQSWFFEPDINTALQSALKSESIVFSLDIAEGLRFSNNLFVCVDTPQLKQLNQTIDLNPLRSLIQKINALATGPTTVIIQSTVPVGTCEQLQKECPHLEIIFKPEFLREGTALKDSLYPDRIVLGCSKNKISSELETLFLSYLKNKNTLLKMNYASAELVKYSANLMLATKLTVMNEISLLCHKVGANINSISEGVGLDSRIGTDFLNAGLGYGGSCFPKDISALIQTAESYDEQFLIAEAVRKANQKQIQRFSNHIVKTLSDLKMNAATITVWGLSFKANTNDIRCSPSIEIVNQLMQNGFLVQSYDPKVKAEFRSSLQSTNGFSVCDSIEDSLRNSDCLVVLTDWEVFKAVDLVLIKKLLRTPYVFDGRNVFDSQKMKELNFNYYSIGRPL